MVSSIQRAAASIQRAPMARGQGCAGVAFFCQRSEKGLKILMEYLRDK